MVMQHHEPEFPAEKLIHCVQCQGHSKGLYNQNMTFSAISSKLLICLQPNWITVFKVKVTAKVQYVNECLSG